MHSTDKPTDLPTRPLQRAATSGRLLAAACLSLLLLGSCARNPVSGQTDFVMMSENQEVAVGRQNDELVKKQYHVYGSKVLQDYVNSVGQRIARQSHRPNLEYHFTVLDSPEINAFALPGGYVYITRGILAYLNSEAELAAVLGHEIGHVTARHGVRQQSVAQAANLALQIASYYMQGLNTAVGQNIANLFGGALLSGYGREHELEADRLGAEYLGRTEYDPQAIIKVIGVLKNQELQDAKLAKEEGREPRRYHGLFATHPDNDTRLKQAVNEADKQKTAVHFEGRSQYLDATDGLVFNDNSDQGVVRDNRFYHGDLGMAVSFPEGWQVHNLPDTLAAVSPQGEAQIQMKLDNNPSGSPSQYARRLAGNQARIDSLEINGLQAAIVELPDTIAGAIYLNEQAFILQAQAKTRSALNHYREQIIDTIRSFHALSNEERKLVKPLTIRVITAHKGDSFAQLARHSPLGKSAESYLRLINAMYPNGEPRPGEDIKIVE